MLDPDQARAYAEADFSEPPEAFAELLLERLGELSESGCALDLGCGPGDISFRVERRLPGWSLISVDAAPAMLELAEKWCVACGLADRVRFRNVHLPQSNRKEPFELVLSNSLLHHLTNPHDLWRAILDWGLPARRSS